jgi:prepilin-type N-terminal cleavage/methylation domain-containing protein
MMNERGFTLAEVLIAAFIITIGFVGLLTALPVASFSIQEGKQLSTATFLANQKLEEARTMPWNSIPANDCLGLSATTSSAPTVPAGGSCTLGATVVNAGGALPWFADQSTTAIPSFAGYSRTVRITSCAVTACGGITDAGMRKVTVTVTYRASSTVAVGAISKPVAVTMVVAQR